MAYRKSRLRGAFAALTCVLAASAGADRVTSASADEGVRCDVGGRPSLPYPRIRGEEEQGIRRLSKPVVIGCGRLPEGKRWELVGYRQSHPGGGSSVCIDLTFPRQGLGFGCDSPRPGDGRLILASVVSGDQFRDDITSGPIVRRVAVVETSFRTANGRRHRRATRTKVSGRRVLERLRQARPFYLFVGTVRKDVNFAVEGFDREGRRIARADIRRP